MAERSTRNKIRWQARKMYDSTEHMLQRAKYLQELAGDRSEYINDTLPILVGAIVEMQKAFKTFEEGL
ncbi:unnamed protein product [marine sediment metagenome]|uniref:Uncharacterized protein n=1 Tax=marine sediment metagenome TaxID=412755 RepID=X1AYP8_9ZZZZ